MNNFFEMVEKHMLTITAIIVFLFAGALFIMPFYFESKRSQITIEAIKAGLEQNDKGLWVKKTESKDKVIEKELK
jgi:predicted transcriptional regulator